jgi:hypothetical protein
VVVHPLPPTPHLASLPSPTPAPVRDRHRFTVIRAATGLTVYGQRATKWRAGRSQDGMRTHEPLRVGDFLKRCLKPLGHPSADRIGQPAPGQARVVHDTRQTTILLVTKWTLGPADALAQVCHC